MTRETGARAAVFLAHGYATFLSTLTDDALETDRAQTSARELLARYFPWSEDDDAFLRSAIALGRADDPRWQLARDAVAIVVGPEQTAALPNFAVLETTAPEALSATMKWQICFTYSTRTFLAATDPDALARWDACQPASGT